MHVLRKVGQRVILFGDDESPIIIEIRQVSGKTVHLDISTGQNILLVKEELVPELSCPKIRIPDPIANWREDGELPTSGDGVDLADLSKKKLWDEGDA